MYIHNGNSGTIRVNCVFNCAAFVCVHNGITTNYKDIKKFLVNDNPTKSTNVRDIYFLLCSLIEGTHLSPTQTLKSFQSSCSTSMNHRYVCMHTHYVCTVCV